MYFQIPRVGQEDMSAERYGTMTSIVGEIKIVSKIINPCYLARVRYTSPAEYRKAKKEGKSLDDQHDILVAEARKKLAGT